jgi:hypothetical protein
MAELLLSADALVVPSSTGRPHTFDMRKIHKAESRLVEMNGITKAKAGELLYTVIDAFGDAKDYHATLKGEFGRCKQKLRSVRGVIVLDKAPDELKAKGLSSARSPAGSEDLRDSVVNTNTDYMFWADVLAQVEVASDRMEAKVEKLKMAYYAISDLIKGPDVRRDTSGGVGDDAPGSLSRSEQTQQFVEEQATKKNYPKGFGAAKL